MKVVLDRQRRMVAELHVLVDGGGAGLVGQGRRGQVVVIRHAGRSSGE